MNNSSKGLYNTFGGHYTPYAVFLLFISDYGIFSPRRSFHINKDSKPLSLKFAQNLLRKSKYSESIEANKSGSWAEVQVPLTYKLSFLQIHEK